MARKLDRGRNFASSYGETPLRFYQDGRWFNAQGDEVDLQGNVIPDPSTQPTVPVAAVPSLPPVAATPAGSAPADEEGGPGVSVEQALGGSEPTVEAAQQPTTESDGKPDSDPKAILAEMNLEQLRRLGKRAGAPKELLEAKGTEARQPLIDWLVSNSE